MHSRVYFLVDDAYSFLETGRIVRLATRNCIYHTTIACIINFEKLLRMHFVVVLIRVEMYLRMYFLVLMLQPRCYRYGVCIFPMYSPAPCGHRNVSGRTYRGRCGGCIGLMYLHASIEHA